MSTIIHGEVVLKPIHKLPTGTMTKHKSRIVGHSETGHHHVLTSKTEFEIIESDEKFFARLFKPAEIVHKKSFDIHETLTVEPGIYEIGHATEYDPFQKVVRKIWD